MTPRRYVWCLCALVLAPFAAAQPARTGLPTPGEDGYDLWLRYVPVEDAALRDAYGAALRAVHVGGDRPVPTAAEAELRRGVAGLLGADLPRVDAPAAGTVVLGTPADSPVVAGLGLEAVLDEVGEEGYVLRAATAGEAPVLVVAANTDVGVLYGTFHLLRLVQTRQDLAGLDVAAAPRIRRRVLNHWDNLDRTVERGYAGFSLWDWHKLPDYVDPRYVDYARANASLGVNGTVLTNVNADATVLTAPYLAKTAALADAFRPYGLQVYLTARFTAPVELGGLATADPLDPAVQAWWRAKVDEIYARVPDFGGFLVKANSEGQPGPQDYGRTHAEGANLLADALAPHGGVVMWRAFVYQAEAHEDRARQAYDEFVPLDGRFRDNVFVQVKNGPIDFQPREPFHPLFGAMPETPLALEVQVTKEYLGQATHLAYLGPLWEEVLDADTYVHGAGSTVARVVDGTLHGHARTAVAGVSNVGTDRNWTGSHFDQANWYAFGRLAWDPDLGAEAVAREWIRMTWSNDAALVDTVAAMMMASRQAVVDYMTPLGLHHLMATGHHYGPGPWVDDLGRPDWNPVYYHRADTVGIGFDRTAAGSDAVGQYAPPLQAVFGDVDRVPEDLLLWFHRVPWDYATASGRPLWEELVHRYHAGVDTVRWMRAAWARLDGAVDPRRHADVAAFLAIQEREAVWWRDASLAYFQTFAPRPIPPGYEAPAHTLDHYRALAFPYAPGH